MPIHLGIIDGCFFAITAELGLFTRNQMINKAENIYCMTLYRKLLQSHVLSRVNCKTFVQVS